MALAGVPPVGLAACVLATLVAVPVLLADGDSAAMEIAAVENTTTSTVPATASLLDDVDSESIFGAGAKEDAPAVLEREHAALTTDPAGDGTESADGTDAAAAAAVVPSGTKASTASHPATPSPATPVPTTVAAPTTAAPTTAAPTTAAPTTAAPTTAAPTTAAPTTAAPTTAAPTATEAPAGDTSGVPTAAQWAALRQCESGGNYGIVSANGLYHGAYQFHPRTWDSVAKGAERHDLVGVLPHAASPADQDHLALKLWHASGWSPWPHCGKKARNA